MIDTLKISKQLEAASLPKAQADAIAEALADVTTAELATKVDLANLELRLNEKINSLRDLIGDVRDQIGNIRDRVNTILLGILGVGAVTWIFGSAIGTAIRKAFGGQP
jgi:hypothetical protein